MTPQARRAIGVLGSVGAAALALLLFVLMRPRARSAPATEPEPAPPTASAAPARAAPLPLPPRAAAARPAPTAVAPLPAAPTVPDAAPKWEDTLDAEGRYAAELMRASVDDLTSGLASVAGRFPSVRVVKIACIDRPCQASVEGYNAADLSGFAKEVQRLYQGHVGGTFTKPPQGGGKFTGTLWVGDLRKDRLDTSALEPPPQTP